MALHDLTPQLRTRLSRVERAVGIFVFLATLLLVTGFFYYAYQTAQRKGWFLIKAPYFTFVRTAAGLKAGDPVKLMGFDVGEITRIEAMPPSDPMFNVYVEFVIHSPYYGYLWSDSRAKLAAGDFLGNRYLEVTKGTNGFATYQINHGEPVKADVQNLPITAIWDEGENVYKPITKDTRPYWLLSDETPALAERLDKLVAQVERSLPGIFDLTNRISEALSNSSQLVQRMDATIQDAQPIVTNLAAITSQLRDPHGGLGNWLLPTQLNLQLQQTLASANSTLNTTETNLNLLTQNLDRTLENLADITGNLRDQVQANSLILSELSSLIVDVDDFIQGLKRNWLLKSSFAAPTNNPLESLTKPSVGGVK